ncbi:hypothetical protein [Streptococcus respiraculi]|uniref:hypothetical protein n=1 Tax=Streptococcus respiraculi TaxID=2021971 RepID=UPI000E76A4A1|nr:hypothetical protein [Streptococcus respiraculi]
MNTNASFICSSLSCPISFAIHYTIAVLRGLGFEVSDRCGILPENDSTEEDLRFYFSPEIWQEVLADIQQYERKRGN